MNPLVLAGAVVAGQYVIESQGGWLAFVGKFGLAAQNPVYVSPAGTATGGPERSGPGNTAAVGYMKALGSVAGIPVVIGQQADASQLSDGGGMSDVLAGMQNSISASTDGAALATAFLGAYDAARTADPVNYALASNVQTANTSDPFSYMWNLAEGTCATIAATDQSEVGAAACALASARDGYGGNASFLAAFGLDSGSIDATQIRDLISALCAAMDAVGYTQPGNAPSDQSGLTLANVNGAINAAITASVNAAIRAALATIGTAATGFLGSPYVWGILLGLVAWKVVA